MDIQPSAEHTAQIKAQNLPVLPPRSITGGLIAVGGDNPEFAAVSVVTNYGLTVNDDPVHWTAVALLHDRSAIAMAHGEGLGEWSRDRTTGSNAQLSAAAALYPVSAIKSIGLAGLEGLGESTATAISVHGTWILSLAGHSEDLELEVTESFAHEVIEVIQSP